MMNYYKNYKEELEVIEEKSKTLSENIKKLAILDAADRIAKEVLDLIAKK